MKRDDRRRKPAEQVKIAKERISILIERAVAVNKEHPGLARRYFQLAKKIGMRYNVKIPAQAKRKFCRKCFSYLGSGWRFRKGRASVVCGNCGAVMRYPYKPKRKR